MKLEQIKAIIAQSLAGLSGSEKVTPSMIDAAVVTASASLNTSIQEVISERDEAVASKETAIKDFDALTLETKANKFTMIANSLKVSPAKLKAFKAFMSEEDIANITDAKSAKLAFAKAAKASDGVLTFNTADGVDKAIAQTASPFENNDDDSEENEDDYKDTSEEAIEATKGAGLGS